MSLFQNSVLNKYLRGLEAKKVDEAYKKFTSHFHNFVVQQNIRNSKEEQYQGGFLIDLFVNILGYTKNPTPAFNLTTELRNVKDAKKTDGAILNGDKVLAVIELKGTGTTDLSKVEAQAFGYKNNQLGCNYVITSNFEKIRFYIDNAVDFEEFNLFEMTKERFDILWLCLSADYLLKDIPKKIKDESLTQEENITEQLYKDYSAFRNDIFSSIQKENPTYDKLTLFKKTQKLLDRFLFIFFAEDRLLLPPNSIRAIVSQWKDLRDKYDEYFPLYDRFNKFFGYMNIGHKGHHHEIFAYNGGLFAPDEILDNIKIDDEILYKHTVNLSNYNYESEVDVNILGHIFEHSLNEIETIQSEIKGESLDKSKTRRKKDGVFYTPKYITKYIVKNTVGRLCDARKAELDIQEEEYDKERKGRRVDTLKQLIKKLEDYREWLLQITICDPACGSGAFLNQALEFLIAEHRYIDELKAKLLDVPMVWIEVENSILENNLYGVDINEESVEIAKLSLWLRTAQKGRALTSLNNNIKCGNSLIDDPDVAGDKAFNWQQEFPEVFTNGGFDVVIGNPPYGIFIDAESQAYYSEHYPLTTYKTNLYILFIERMLQIFEKGIVHFIIPKSLLFNTYNEAIREALIQNSEINDIYTITEKVFEDAEVGSSLLLQFTITKEPNLKNIVRLSSAEKIENFVTNYGVIENKQPQDYFLSVPNCEISVTSFDSQTIIKKLRKLNCVKDFYTLKNGLNPGNIKHILISEDKLTEKHKPIIWGRDISRYNLIWSGQFINYDEDISKTITIDDIKSKKGMNKQTKIDFALRTPELFENEKILVRKTGDSLIACFDNENHYFDTLVHGIYLKNSQYSLNALLAILNSKPATVFYRLLHDIKGKVFAKISLTNLSSFPMPKFNDKPLLDEKVIFIKEMIDSLAILQANFLNLLDSKFEINKTSRSLSFWYDLSFKDFLKELGKAKVKLRLSEEAEWMQYFNEQKEKAQSLKAEIDRTNNEIDQLVYQLYGLTKEEIEIVEEASL